MAVIPVSNYKVVLTKLITYNLLHGDSAKKMSDGGKNMSSQMISLALKKLRGQKRVVGPFDPPNLVFTGYVLVCIGNKFVVT